MRKAREVCIPPSLVSLMIGEVRVMVQETWGSVLLVTIMAASSTQRFTSYLSSVTVYTKYNRLLSIDLVQNSCGFSPNSSVVHNCYSSFKFYINVRFY